MISFGRRSNSLGGKTNGTTPSPCELPKPARFPGMDVEGRCMMSVAHRQPPTSTAAATWATGAEFLGHLDRRNRHPTDALISRTQPRSLIMDSEHVKGAADKMKGTIKDTAGKITGDKELQAEGKFDKAKAPRMVPSERW